MWRDAARRMLVGIGLVDEPDLTAKFVDRHPNPSDIPEKVVVVVRGSDQLKWACFRCPGGCGNRFQLPLGAGAHPRWTISSDWLNRVTVFPSVLQADACHAHFWIRAGRVAWCLDSGPHKIVPVGP